MYLPQYSEHGIDLGVHGADLPFEVGDGLGPGPRFGGSRRGIPPRKAFSVSGDLVRAAETIDTIHGLCAIRAEWNLAGLPAFTAHSIEFWAATFLTADIRFSEFVHLSK